MNKLTKYAFANLYAMASGISTTKEQAGHGSPFVSFSTVFNNYFLPDTLPDLMDTSLKEQETYSIKKGDILVTRTSETIDELAMSCVAVKDYPCATYSGFTKRLRPLTTGIAYDKYLAFYLRGYLFRKAVTNNAFMTLRASFNEDIFSFLNLYLPDYQEQVKIGDMLYNMEQKIQLNKQICAELEAMAKTIYDYWFVQFDFPDENGRPYRTSGGEMVWNEQLQREIPKGWDVKHLQDICRFRNGINYEKDCLGDYTYRIANVRNITVSSFLMDVSDFDEITLPKNQGDKYILSENDIIIARSGTPGATRLVIKPSNNVIFCGFIICCTPFNSQCRLFLSYFLKQLEGTNATKTGGSILQNVSQDTLKSLQVTLPNDSVLNRFNQKIEPLVQMMQNIINENRELAKLRDCLLPMLMNGQARVE
jgi:type I restriction enzyme S subunit